MKRKMAMALAAVLVAGSLPVTASAATFTDINEVSWASSTIQAVSDKGLINGYEDGTFRAKNNVTYSEAMVMIYNLMGQNRQFESKCDKYTAHLSVCAQYIQDSYMEPVHSGLWSVCADFDGS